MVGFFCTSVFPRSAVGRQARSGEGPSAPPSLTSPWPCILPNLPALSPRARVAMPQPSRLCSARLTISLMIYSRTEKHWLFPEGAPTRFHPGPLFLLFPFPVTLFLQPLLDVAFPYAFTQ